MLEIFIINSAVYQPFNIFVLFYLHSSSLLRTQYPIFISLSKIVEYIFGMERVNGSILLLYKTVISVVVLVYP